MATRSRRVVSGRWRLVCLALAMALLCLTSTAAQAEPQGSAVIGQTQPFNLRGGDPHTVTGGAAVSILYAVFDGLAVQRPGKGFTPALAKSWKMSKDCKTLTCYLDERARFHNGAPVTAGDVKFSYERCTQPGLKFLYGRQMKRTIGKIEVINPHTVVFHLKKPDPWFIQRYGQWVGVIPKAYFEKVGDAGFAAKPIGAGPFKWVAAKQDDFVKLEAFEGHYRKVPYVKNLLMRIVPEASTMYAMLKTGEMDVATLSSQHVPLVQRDEKLRIKWSKYVTARNITFFDLVNPKVKSPFLDRRVREAVGYAVNKAMISKNVLNGACVPYGDIIAPYQSGYDPSVKPYPYDPKKAKELLTAAGYPNGFATTMTTPPAYKLITQAVSQDLMKVGIMAKIVVLEHATWKRQYFKKMLKGIGVAPLPYWLGRSNPGLTLNTTFSKRIPWTYVVVPELSDAVDKMSLIENKEALAAAARKTSQAYRKYLTQIVMFARFNPFGLGPKVVSWENLEGFPAYTSLEYLKIKR